MKLGRSFRWLVVALIPIAFLLPGCSWDDDDGTAAAPAPQGHLLDNNTVALWRLNETTASDNAADAKGSYHLVPFGDPDIVAGQVGNARKLDGSAKFFQKQGDAAFGTAMNGDWTFEGWVYLDNTFSAQADLFIYNGLNFSSVPGDVILAEVGLTATKKVYWHQWHNYTPANDFTLGESTATLSTGQFTHVAVTRTAEGGNLFTYRIYINGALDNTVTGVAGLDYAATGASHYIGLGCYTGLGGLGNGGNVHNGRLDDIRISRVARTGTEIQDSYQRGR